jgi:hypothetical protein
MKINCRSLLAADKMCAKRKKLWNIQSKISTSCLHRFKSTTYNTEAWNVIRSSPFTLQCFKSVSKEGGNAQYHCVMDLCCVYHKVWGHSSIVASWFVPRVSRGMTSQRVEVTSYVLRLRNLGKITPLQHFILKFCCMIEIRCNPNKFKFLHETTEDSQTVVSMRSSFKL